MKSSRHPSVWQRWVVQPIVSQLTQGVTPRELALAIAVGVATGLFPLLGLTTVAALAVGIPLRLNQLVLQLFKELMYPLHLATILVFIRLGELLFGVEHVPLSLSMLWDRFLADPGQFLSDFGLVALRAVTVWLLVAPLLAGLVYLACRPLVERLAHRLHLHRHAA